MRAELSFTRLMAEVPVPDIAAGFTGVDVDTREVELADADATSPAPTLATHGFEAVPFSAEPPPTGLDRAFGVQFVQRCVAALRQTVGAAAVVTLPGSLQLRRSDGAKGHQPLVVCHSDFTPGSATRRATTLLEQINLNREPTRFAAFNAWWLARPGAQDRPLALCDANSIAPSDLQFGNVRVPGANNTAVDFGEIAYQRYSSRSRWYWYPRLGPDRLLLFCGFDSDPTRPSLVTHCAFTNPECPPDAPPRVSLECRCIAFW